MVFADWMFNTKVREPLAGNCLPASRVEMRINTLPGATRGGPL